jgi:hypothetical protein
MTHAEALEKARKLNDHDDLWAKVVRILPEEVDPQSLLDNGWDVEVEVIS